MVNITNEYIHSRWLQCSNAQNSNKALGLHYDVLGKKKDVFNFGNLDAPSMVKLGLETSLVNDVFQRKALDSNRCGSQISMWLGVVYSTRKIIILCKWIIK